MATLTHQQTRSVDGTSYRVVSTITAADGVPAEVFVFAASGAAFNRVASVDDLLTLPTSITSNVAYYRAATVDRGFTTLRDADAFARYVKTHLPALVKEYNQAVTAFIGTSTDTVSS